MLDGLWLCEGTWTIQTRHGDAGKRQPGGAQRLYASRAAALAWAMVGVVAQPKAMLSYIDSANSTGSWLTSATCGWAFTTQRQGMGGSTIIGAAQSSARVLVHEEENTAGPKRSKHLEARRRCQ